MTKKHLAFRSERPSPVVLPFISEVHIIASPYRGSKHHPSPSPTTSICTRALEQQPNSTRLNLGSGSRIVESFYPRLYLQNQNHLRGDTSRTSQTRNMDAPHYQCITFPTIYNPPQPPSSNTVRPQYHPTGLCWKTKARNIYKDTRVMDWTRIYSVQPGVEGLLVCSSCLP